jgi:hypothetical protein
MGEFVSHENCRDSAGVELSEINVITSNGGDLAKLRQSHLKLIIEVIESDR